MVLLLNIEELKRRFQEHPNVKAAIEFAGVVTADVKAKIPPKPIPKPVTKAPNTNKTGQGEADKKDAPSRTMAGNLAIFNRVYVGSVHTTAIREADVKLALSIFGPVKSVQIITDTANQSTTKPHKGYGFVEFDAPEAAELSCQAENAITLAGRQLKIGRPANFPTDLPPGVPRPPANRIYIGNVSAAVGQSELQSFLESIGPVTGCRLVYDPIMAAHRGFGYVEFERSTDAQTAIVLLHGFELAGHRLAVAKAMVGGPLPEGVPDKALIESLNTVIVMRGICDKHEVEDLKNRQDMADDIVEECKKFGTVMDHQLIICLDDTVNFYVRFESNEQATMACNALHNRWFGGKQITCELYNVDRYTMRDFT